MLHVECCFDVYLNRHSFDRSGRRLEGNLVGGTGQ